MTNKKEHWAQWFADGLKKAVKEEQQLKEQDILLSKFADKMAQSMNSDQNKKSSFWQIGERMMENIKNNLLGRKSTKR